MAQNTNWLPGRREFQLTMAKNWVTILKTRGSDWNIKKEEVLKLSNLAEEAEKIYTKAVSSERTALVTAQCKEIFGTLVDFMRELETHYFFNPPLSDADFASLDLKPKNMIMTPVQSPTGQAEADVSSRIAHLLLLRLRPLSGTSIDSKTVHGFRIFYGIMPPGGATDEQAESTIKYLKKPPKSGEDLPHSKFTRRKKELFEFSPNDSGSTVYFCIRYENSLGEPGPWGPLFEAAIP